MRALLGLVIGMGVLIVAGVAVIAVTVIHRMGAAEGADGAREATILLHEPAGTRIAGVSTVGSRLALLLQGGGGDRVVLLDARDGRTVGVVRIAP